MEEVGFVKKGVSMMIMSFVDLGYRFVERWKWVKSEIVVFVLVVGVDFGVWYVNLRRNSFGISNGVFDRCVNKLNLFLILWIFWNILILSCFLIFFC